MIAYKGREVKRGRKTQMARNIERLYKEGKCRDCSVIVTRMDFAKILGKFTKVKIQYENVSSPKTKKVNIQAVSSPNDSRLKPNENGMVLVRRNAFQKHPINNSQSFKKNKFAVSGTSTPQSINNVLKENNGLQKTVVLKDKNSDYNSKPIQSNSKQYTVIFQDPKINNNRDNAHNITLAELVSKVDKSILPSKDWIIEYSPKTKSIKNDKVYDRIEAELEGLMFSEKTEEKPVQVKSEENKADEFPSIMDILNDNYSIAETKQNDQNVIIEFKNNLESSDVEAMLLGKSESTPMEVDSSVMSKIIEDVENISAVVSVDKNVNKSEQIVELSIKENPQSPSILDETLQKGVEEHIPALPIQIETPLENKDTTEQKESDQNIGMCSDSNNTKDTKSATKMDIDSPNTLNETSCDTKLNNFQVSNLENVSQIIFKKVEDGKCLKAVTCPKNLKYQIEFDGKSVEFLAAPKYISSIEDLQVLLQIVNESELDSLYVLY